MSDEQAVVLVTGAARGIGFGIAEAYAATGVSVAVADVAGEQAQEAAARLASAFGVRTLGVSCDVTKRASVEAMAAQVEAALGPIDVLVNNAGICPFIDAMAMTPETFTKTLEVNLTGPFHCTQAVAARMIARKACGSIIFITSLNEDFTNPEQVDYASSKGGLRMQMKAFALALGPHGIRCNAVAPGIMLTDMTASTWEQPDKAAYIAQRVPVGRIGLPRDIGGVCVFLSSPAAGYVSGTTITVDGGFSASCP